MVHLGRHWDTLRAHLGALGPHLGFPGIVVVPWESDLGGPGLHFKSPGAPDGYIFLIWQRFC